jgi:hypothetical protein
LALEKDWMSVGKEEEEHESEHSVEKVKTGDSQYFKGLRRGVLRAILDLKAENGVFFRTEVFLDSTFSFFS